MRFPRRFLFLAFVATLSLNASAQQKTGTAPSAKDKTKSVAVAKGPTNPVSLTADGLGAKAHLEDILARRYAQELATLVDHNEFAISAKLDLVETAPKVKEEAAPEKDNELPFDLRIGTIDPDELLRRYADPELQEKIGSFLSNYRITKATLTVGLQPGVSADTKKLVETWLSTRTSQEFGEAGVGSVSYVQQKKKEFLDRLGDFQGLAGQFLLSMAIVLGALFWALSKKGGGGVSKSQVQTEQSGNSAGGAPVAAGGAPVETKNSNSDSEDQRMIQEIDAFGGKLAELGQSLSTDKESVIRSWCEEGEAGKLKLACFAEAAGRSLGRLPIPADAVQDLTKIFASMPTMAAADKRDHLRKAYWDLVSAVNLGTDSLRRPFGYLSTLNVDSIGQALVEQNVKMKALVSVHMPTQLRQSFLQSLDSDTKKSLVQEAANLGSIPAAQYREMETEFKARLSGDSAEDVVAFDAALEKMAEALSPIEEISVMSEIQGPSAERYRKTVPSLAFLDRWPDDKLGSLLSSAMPNELVAYLRLRPDQQSRIIALSPPMAGAVAQDELTRPDSVSDDDKNRTLSTLLGRVKTLVEQGEVNLQNIFATSSAPDDTGGSDGQQSAA